MPLLFCDRHSQINLLFVRNGSGGSALRNYTRLQDLGQGLRLEVYLSAIVEALYGLSSLPLNVTTGQGRREKRSDCATKSSLLSM